MKTSLLRRVLAGLALSLAGVGAASALPAQFIIVNINAAGVGFNDPTPAAPVGGNTGTTLGEQRQIAFTHAASIWSARLDSDVPIRIRAQFVPLGAGVLGSAGPVSVVRDFPNAPLGATWYHVALANALAGVDLIPTGDDINANFSTNFPFYLGIDNQAPPGQPDLVAVLLHEFAHGLGFSQFASLTTGNLFNGFPDVYNSRLFDSAQGLHWPQMTSAQRLVSATSFGRVVWSGANVTANVPDVLVFGSPEVNVTSPPAIAGAYQFGTAAFGPPVGSPNVAAQVVAAVDAVEAGGTSTDGCSPFDNAAAIAGRIALIERGLCAFAVKARNATNAGAAGAIIYNNAANVNAAPPGLGDDGINGAFVTIPTVSVRRADGLSIVAQLGGGVTASIGVNDAIRAGADALGRARVYAPFPVVGGSSISHYDSVARRNLLMEPSINSDLTHLVKSPFDLTWELFRDIGWTFPDADGDGYPDDEDCNPGSIVTATIVVGGIDTGVPNTVHAGGCTSSDLIAEAKSEAKNHGGYVSAVAHLTNGWVLEGLINGGQKGSIQSAVARDN
ncbi:MAG TPA: PA domain-containing protein [Steroidobacteraceae bacterium]|nr:PA domain-containing protein [Steroidobacteraceae bacterium]